MEGTIDEVIVKVTGKVDKSSVDSINSLTESLGKLKQSIKGGYNNLNKLGTALTNLAKSSKSLNTIKENFSSVTQISNKLSTLTNIGSPKGLNNMIKVLNQLPKVFAQLDTNTLTQIDEVAKNLNQHLVPLAGTLAYFKDSIKGGFGGLGKLSQYLLLLKDATKGLDKTVGRLNVVPQLVEALQPLSTITSPKGLTKTIKNLELLPDVIAKITPDTLQNVARVANELSVALTPLANKFADIAVGFSSLQALADKYGVSVTKITERTNKTINKMTLLKKVVEAIKSPFAKLSNSFNSFGKGAHRGFDKLISKTKQLGLSLLGTRSIFTATRKAISEYMQMDEELTKATTNLWRALGAQLAPAVEFVLYLFKQFTRAVYSFVYAITGVDLIARANAKAMAGWGKSVKDTLGNLQKFDDLHVADFGKGSGDNALIKLGKIDLSPIQWIIDATIRIKNAFKEAFNTGQWKGVGKELANLGNDIIEHIKPKVILKYITSKIIKPLSDVINTFFKKLNWSGLGNVVGELFGNIFLSISELLNNINFTTIGDRISRFFLGLNVNDVLKSINKFFEAIYTAIDTLIDGIIPHFGEIDNVFGELGTTFAESINLFFGQNWGKITYALTSGINAIFTFILNALTNINWKEIGSNIAKSLNTFFNTFDYSKVAQSINVFVHGAFTTITTAIKETDWGKLGEDIVNFILDIDWGQFLLDVADFIDTSIEKMADLLRNLGKTIWDKIKSGILEGDTRSLGERLTDGIMMGAAYSATSKNSISKALRYFVGFMRGFFGIHSPSTLMRDELGKPMARGIAEGFGGLWDMIKPTMNALNTNLLSNVRTILNNIISMFNSTKGNIESNFRVNASTNRSSMFNNSPSMRIPSLAIGTNDIPYEGLYHLHEGESVVPKKYNPAVGGGYTGELDEKIDKLITIVENMDTTTTVNVGNKTLYEEQRRYNNFQRNKYGSIKV